MVALCHAPVIIFQIPDTALSTIFTGSVATAVARFPPAPPVPPVPAIIAFANATGLPVTTASAILA